MCVGACECTRTLRVQVPFFVFATDDELRTCGRVAIKWKNEPSYVQRHHHIFMDESHRQSKNNILISELRAGRP